MFCGDSRHSVDAKHRVFVPKRFQQGLPLDDDGNRSAILARGLDGCLYLFTQEALDRALERLDTDAFAAPLDRRIARQFFSYASGVTLDASGRLLISEKLRRVAGIEKEVVMVGIRDRIEIWAAERWDAMEAELGDSFEVERELAGSPRGDRP